MNARLTHAARIRTQCVVLVVALAASLLAALGLAAAPAPAATSSATPLEQAAARTEPAIVQLGITWGGKVYDTRNKQFISNDLILSSFRCTGFFVNGQGYIGSAGHCVNYDAEVEQDLIYQAALTAIKTGYYRAGTTPEAILAASKTDYQVTEHTEPVVKVYFSAQMSGITMSNSLTARVIASKTFDDGDVSLLKVDATNTPALRLAQDSTIVVGEHNVSIGYPGQVVDTTDPSLAPSFKDGTISSQRSIGDGKFKVYETSAAIGGGMSGGPTIDDNGDVIGVNSFGPANSDAAFNFIRPSEMLQELLDSQGVENTVDATQKEYLAGLAAYYAGKRADALAHFDNVLAIVPSHSFALHYRTLALSLPKQGSSHTLRDMLILAALLLGALTGGVVIRRRRGAGDDGSVALAPVTAPSTPAEGPRTAAPASALTGYALVVDATGERHPVDRPFVIGREGADICVDDLEASRRHAGICPSDDGGLELRDLDSANGTFVNDHRLESEPLRLAPGDVIRVGRSLLRVDRQTTAAERRRMQTVIGHA